MIIFFIICYGLTLVIVQSKLLNPIRNYITSKSKFFGELINCMMCTSFWVGILVSLLTKVSPTSLMSHRYCGNIDILSIFFDGFCSVGVVWFIYLIQCLIEDNLKREL